MGKYSKVTAILIYVSILVFSINQFFVISHLDILRISIPNLVYLFSTIYLLVIILRGKIFINSYIILFILFTLFGIIRIPFLDYRITSMLSNLYSLIMPMIAISFGISLFIYENDMLYEKMKKYENIFFFLTLFLFIFFVIGSNFGIVKYRVFYLLNLFLLVNIYISDIRHYRTKFIITIIIAVLTFKRSLLLMIFSSIFFVLLFNDKIKLKYKVLIVVLLSAVSIFVINSETLMKLLRLHYIFDSTDFLTILNRVTSSRIAEIQTILTYYSEWSDYIFGKGIGFEFAFKDRYQHFSHFILLSYGNMLGWVFAIILFLKMLYVILKPFRNINNSTLFYKSILFGFLMGSLTSGYILYYPFYWVIFGVLVTKQSRLKKKLDNKKLKTSV